jgi:AAA family ATP:ADP antiporter
LLARFLRIEEREKRPVLLAFSCFFCVLSSYYILRPIREEMGIFGGRKNLPWLFTATFVVMVVAAAAYGWLVARVPRGKILPWAYRFFSLNLLLFFLIWQWGEGRVVLARVYFVWLSVFNLLVVSVFWSLMADSFRSTQGKRLFGIVAAGGSAGAVAGPLLTTLLVERTGIAPLFLVSIALLEAAVLLAGRFVRWAEREGPGMLQAHASERIGGGLLAGFRSAMSSPYYLGIAGLMALYSICSTVVYFEQARIVEEAIADPAARTALFARIDLTVNLLSAGTQAFGVGRLLTWAGVGTGLALLPALTSLGLVALALRPGVGMIAAVQIVRRTVHYAVERPAREVLFTVVPPEDKYKAKGFLDTVVYRGADAVGGWISTGLGTLGMGVAAVSFGAVPLAMIGIPLAYWMGKLHKERA